MPLIKDVFHPASYTVDDSLSGVQAKFIDCTCNLLTACMCLPTAVWTGEQLNVTWQEQNPSLSEFLAVYPANSMRGTLQVISFNASQASTITAEAITTMRGMLQVNYGPS